jgi:hypothetical protein
LPSVDAEILASWLNKRGARRHTGPAALQVLRIHEAGRSPDAPVLRIHEAGRSPDAEEEEDGDGWAALNDKSQRGHLLLAYGMGKGSGVCHKRKRFPLRTGMLI